MTPRFVPVVSVTNNFQLPWTSVLVGGSPNVYGPGGAGDGNTGTAP